MNHHRPLTPLERALLRAVVELGDEASGVLVQERAEDILGGGIGPIWMNYVLGQLEREGFVRHITSPGNRYWRPAIDLTDILAAAGGGSDGDKETRS